jgi:hypothetical protein
MNLAAVLAFCLVSLGSLSAVVTPWAARTAQNPAAVASSGSSQSAATPSPPQTPSTRAPGSAQSVPSSTGQTTNPAPQAKPHKRTAHPKKTIYADCSSAPTALNPAAGSSSGSAKPVSPAHSASGSTGAPSSKAGTVTGNSAKASTNPASPSKKPCPPPKKVVRNGGSNEPDIQLLGGTTTDQVANQRSTEELTFAAEENLKKIAGRQLDATEQETVNQIKQFMEQSKQAVAAGDAERGHDLAMKARLLSDELVKP